MPPAQNMDGETFAHYSLLGKLGQGGMGEVYLARDTYLERNVAVKFLAHDQVADTAARTRFFSEARAAAAIDHPFICKVYEVGESDGRVFIAMEFVEGETLGEWLQNGPVTAEVLRAAREIAEALEKAHRTGIVHRDLKPGNIMRTIDGHVKVMDFGLAKRVITPDNEATIFDESTADGLVQGTLSYMSPEQAKGERVGPASDVFSFGIVLYEMLTGKNPFRRASPFESAAAILSEAPAPLASVMADCPQSLNAIVSRMLAKRVDDRYANATPVLQDLNSLADSSETFAIRILQPSPATLAVLPFACISPNKDDEYFSDGMTEEIIIRLSKLKGLKVISRTSVMRFKSSNAGLELIGQELGADTIVEGSVRRAGNRVRIAAKLIDVQADSQIWAESYDRELEDIFAIQTEVSEQIAGALTESMSTEAHEGLLQAPPQDIEAYHDYLKGRFFLYKLTAEGINSAIRHFKATLARDPAYARAFAGLSTCYAYAGHFCYLPVSEAFPQAKLAAAKALELDPSLAEAHDSIGLVALFYDWDWPVAEHHFQRAIELNPSSSEALLHQSWHLVAMGRTNEAIRTARKAVQLDPLSLLASVNLGWLLFFARRYPESIEQYQKTLKLEPEYVLAHDLLAASLLLEGDVDQALQLLEERNQNRTHLVWAYALSGQQEHAQDLIAEITGSGETECSPFDIALSYLLLEERDEGFAYLEKAIEERDSKIVYLREHPYMRSFRGDPRMIAISERIGLPMQST